MRIRQRNRARELGFLLHRRRVGGEQAHLVGAAVCHAESNVSLNGKVIAQLDFDQIRLQIKAGRKAAAHISGARKASLHTVVQYQARFVHHHALIRGLVVGEHVVYFGRFALKYDKAAALFGNCRHLIIGNLIRIGGIQQEKARAYRQTHGFQLAQPHLVCADAVKVFLANAGQVHHAGAEVHRGCIGEGMTISARPLLRVGRVDTGQHRSARERVFADGQHVAGQNDFLQTAQVRERARRDGDGICAAQQVRHLQLLRRAVIAGHDRVLLLFQHHKAPGVLCLLQPGCDQFARQRRKV